MKIKTHWMGVSFFLLGVAGLALAQPPGPVGGPPPPPPPELDGPPPGMRPGGPSGPLDLWLERLEKRNPEEFHRFHRLRREDPEGFRRELRDRLGRELDEALAGAHPKLAAFLDSLPEEERRELIEAVGRTLRRYGPGPVGPPNPRIREKREALRQLAAEWRRTDDPRRRSSLEEELRAKLGELFDAREAERVHQIERILAEADRLKQMLEFRRARRAEIIERRLRELTEGKETDW